MQGLEYCGGNGVWTNKEVHSPTSPPSHLSLISPPPPPAYFPCMNRARECKLRPALQRVCTHLPFSVSFCTDDVCHKCSADWIVPYGEWRCFVNIELFPSVSSEPKNVPELSALSHYQTPHSRLLFISRAFLPLTTHKRERSQTVWKRKWNISLYPSREREIRCIFTHARPPGHSSARKSLRSDIDDFIMASTQFNLPLRFLAWNVLDINVLS